MCGLGWWRDWSDCGYRCSTGYEESVDRKELGYRDLGSMTIGEHDFGLPKVDMTRRRQSQSRAIKRGVAHGKLNVYYRCLLGI